MSTIQKEALWLWLNYATGPQTVVFEQIISKYLHIEEVYALANARDTHAFRAWGKSLEQRLFDSANEQFIEEKLQWLEKHGVQFIPLYKDEYPALLKEIRHPPAVLFIKGTLPAEVDLPIAIVGMRKHTDYGERVARHLGEEIALSGGTIVSGMARGIDQFAAEGALRVPASKCPTIAVLGSGIDVVYPNENLKLYHEIAERGAVITEFLPGTRPLRENFPMRNRVISGLSRGVVVVEAAERSGTSITVNHALDQGRDVFAVPGRITDINSVGPNRLIQSGAAKPVFCAADILCEYGVKRKAAQAKTEIDTTTLSPLEKRIVEALLSGEKNADELCEYLELDVAEVNCGLTSLQFSGIIKQLPGRVFGLS
ncbi:DNA-processing protein DprA [Christensenellaceae bacterium OttesenSCG-928-L17]|nr:DNA-processing protein DprA [Christensenellaceae bacterium OttesenSCG-928-L17]